jgi:uroporphyrinogen decarboxylase
MPVSGSRMSKVDRVLAALRGAPVDRMPISFWYHFRLEDQPPAVFADAELAFYRKYDVDWLKVMHDYPFGSPELLGSVKSPADWRKLRPVAPRAGGFAKQADALRRIGDGLAGEAMYIDTIFDPWSTAQKLCGNAGVEHLRTDREALREGLKIIGESLAGYVPVALSSGASGIYLATAGASADLMTADDYIDVVEPADQVILAAAKGAPFNVLHVHGERIHFRELTGYPVHGISWSFGITKPTIAEARAMYSGCIITGIDETRVARMSKAEIEGQVKAAIQDAGGRGISVASGGAVPGDPPDGNLNAARAAVEG